MSGKTKENPIFILSFPNAAYPRAKLRDSANEIIISHDVFLWTLSRVINSFITRDKALRGTLCNSTIKDHTSHAARYGRNSHTKQGLQKHVFLRPKTQYPLHKKAPLDNPERLSKSYIPVLQASGKADGLRTVGPHAHQRDGRPRFTLDKSDIVAEGRRELRG